MNNQPQLKKQRSSLFRISKSKKLPGDFFSKSIEKTSLVETGRNPLEQSEQLNTPRFPYRKLTKLKREHLCTQGCQQETTINGEKEDRSVLQWLSQNILSNSGGVLPAKRTSLIKNDFNRASNSFVIKKEKSRPLLRGLKIIK